MSKLYSAKSYEECIELFQKYGVPREVSSNLTLRQTFEKADEICLENNIMVEDGDKK